MTPVTRPKPLRSLAWWQTATAAPAPAAPLAVVGPVGLVGLVGLVVLVFALGLALAPAPAAFGQDEEPAEEPAGPGGAADEGMPDIDAIMESDEEIWSGGGYSYDPGDRRDPFKSLLDPRELEERTGPRPEGVPGLLIDEITLTGIFRTRQGWIAQVQATNQEKAYLIKEGDQLYDGDVVSIGNDEVVFKQVVQDPTALKPFREVVKTLNP